MRGQTTTELILRTENNRQAKGSYRRRLTLESWHTACTKDADNNSKHLPEQYRLLLKKTLNSTQYIYVGGTVSNFLLSVNVIVNRFCIALFTLYHILYN